MPPRDFATTNWTLVLAVHTTSPAKRRDALAGLCEGYWHPVYAFIRRRGHDADAAADITQSFFTHVLEKDVLDGVDPSLGRFRAFLLVAVKNFLANQWDHDAARKRGGGWTRVPYELPELERRYEAARSADLDPEQLFEQRWAATVLTRAVERVKAQQHAAGREREFTVLSPFLTSDGGEHRPYREVAVELRTTETALRTAVHRLRHALGVALREEVGDTVSDAAVADTELRHLLGVLAMA